MLAHAFPTIVTVNDHARGVPMAPGTRRTGPQRRRRDQHRAVHATTRLIVHGWSTQLGSFTAASEVAPHVPGRMFAQHHADSEPGAPWYT
jgi:hypothetical protein